MGDKHDSGRRPPLDTNDLDIRKSTDLATPSPTPTTVKPRQTSLSVAERARKFEESNGKPLVPQTPSTIPIKSTSTLRNRSLDQKDENQNPSATGTRNSSVDSLKKPLFGEIMQTEINGNIPGYGIAEIRSKLPVASRIPSTPSSISSKSPRTSSPYASRPTASSRNRAAGTGTNGADGKVGRRPTLEDRRPSSTSSKPGAIDFHPLQARIREGTREKMQKVLLERAKFNADNLEAVAHGQSKLQPPHPSSMADVVLLVQNDREGKDPVGASLEDSAADDLGRVTESPTSSSPAVVSVSTPEPRQPEQDQDTYVPEEGQNDQGLVLEVKKASIKRGPQTQTTQLDVAAEKLHLATDFRSPNQDHIATANIGEDSPTLGKPVIFQRDEAPLSAVSNGTEFDDETQTEAPIDSVDSGPYPLENHDQTTSVTSEDVFEQKKYPLGVFDRSSIHHLVVDDSHPPSPSQEDQISPRTMNRPEFVVAGLRLANSALINATQSGDVTPQSDTTFGEDISSLRSRPDSFEGTPDDEDAMLLGYQVNAFELPFLHVPPHLDMTEVFTSDIISQERSEVNNRDQTDVQLRRPLSAYLDPIQRTNRSSYQSTWTDASAQSTEHSTEPEASRVDSAADFSQETAKGPTPPPKTRPPSLKPPVPPKPLDYSPQPSPVFAQRGSVASADTQQSFPDQISEARGRQSFDPRYSAETETTASSTSATIPSYPPPPPPVPNSGITALRQSRTPPSASHHNRRPPSSSYRASHNGTPQDGDSQIESDDAYKSFQSTSSLLSSARDSLAESDTAARTWPEQSLSDVGTARPELPHALALPEPSDSERARWFQRYSVIKELVDTEAGYLKDMHVFREIYKGTAEACLTLTVADRYLLFRNISEIVRFTTDYLESLKAAAAAIYVPHTRHKSRNQSQGEAIHVTKSTFTHDHEEKDRLTRIARAVLKNLDVMQVVYGDFLKHQARASERLKELQSDPAVACWLKECNKVAQELTAAWDIDSLWSKPLQRITKLPLTLSSLQKQTPEDHPDYKYLKVLIPRLTEVVEGVNAAAGQANAATRKRAPSNSNQKTRMAIWKKLSEARTSKETKTAVDVEFNKAFNANHNDFLRVQIIVRDIEEYCRATTDFCAAFERCVTCIEGMVVYVGKKDSNGSAWKDFSESIAAVQARNLPQHIANIQRWVLGPLDEMLKVFVSIQVKTHKRFSLLASHDKYTSYQKAGKKIDDRLVKAESDYQYVNKTLKHELPVFGLCLNRIVNHVHAKFISEQVEFVWEWQNKLYEFYGNVASHCGDGVPEDYETIRHIWSHKFSEASKSFPQLRLLMPTEGKEDRGKRSSMSKSMSSSSNIKDSASSTNVRPAARGSRSRGQSVATNDTNSDHRQRMEREDSHMYGRVPVAHRPISGTPATPDSTTTSPQWSHGLPRPQTGRSSSSNPRPQIVPYDGPDHEDWSARISESFGLFSSAMPLEDTLHESAYYETNGSRTPSRRGEVAPQHPRPQKTLYMAASLFEFNIAGIKTEAGYPYLTYPAGDIFDVIAEKGELWLAKNNEDPSHRVGWIWSKHFARFASTLDDEDAQAMNTKEETD